MKYIMIKCAYLVDVLQLLAFVLQGSNACVLVYGAPKTGKTYTLEVSRYMPLHDVPFVA
jgi:hypothetical protein